MIIKFKVSRLDISRHEHNPLLRVYSVETDSMVQYFDISKKGEVFEFKKDDGNPGKTHPVVFSLLVDQDVPDGMMPRKHTPSAAIILTRSDLQNFRKIQSDKKSSHISQTYVSEKSDYVTAQFAIELLEVHSNDLEQDVEGETLGYADEECKTWLKNLVTQFSSARARSTILIIMPPYSVGTQSLPQYIFPLLGSHLSASMEFVKRVSVFVLTMIGMTEEKLLSMLQDDVGMWAEFSALCASTLAGCIPYCDDVAFGKNGDRIGIERFGLTEMEGEGDCDDSGRMAYVFLRGLQTMDMVSENVCPIVHRMQTALKFYVPFVTASAVMAKSIAISGDKTSDSMEYAEGGHLHGILISHSELRVLLENRPDKMSRAEDDVKNKILAKLLDIGTCPTGIPGVLIAEGTSPTIPIQMESMSRLGQWVQSSVGRRRARIAVAPNAVPFFAYVVASLGMNKRAVSQVFKTVASFSVDLNRFPDAAFYRVATNIQTSYFEDCGCITMSFTTLDRYNLTVPFFGATFDHIMDRAHIDPNVLTYLHPMVSEISKPESVGWLKQLAGPVPKLEDSSIEQAAGCPTTKASGLEKLYFFHTKPTPEDGKYDEIVLDTVLCIDHVFSFFFDKLKTLPYIINAAIPLPVEFEWGVRVHVLDMTKDRYCILQQVLRGPQILISRVLEMMGEHNNSNIVSMLMNNASKISHSIAQSPSENTVVDSPSEPSLSYVVEVPEGTDPAMQCVFLSELPQNMRSQAFVESRVDVVDSVAEHQSVHELTPQPVEVCDSAVAEPLCNATPAPEIPTDKSLHGWLAANVYPRLAQELDECERLFERFKLLEASEEADTHVSKIYRPTAVLASHPSTDNAAYRVRAVRSPRRRVRVHKKSHKTTRLSPQLLAGDVPGSGCEFQYVRMPYPAKETIDQSMDVYRKAILENGKVEDAPSNIRVFLILYIKRNLDQGRVYAVIPRTGRGGNNQPDRDSDAKKLALEAARCAARDLGQGTKSLLLENKDEAMDPGMYNFITGLASSGDIRQAYDGVLLYTGLIYPWNLKLPEYRRPRPITPTERGPGQPGDVCELELPHKSPSSDTFPLFELPSENVLLVSYVKGYARTEAATLFGIHPDMDRLWGSSGKDPVDVDVAVCKCNIFRARCETNKGSEDVSPHSEAATFLDRVISAELMHQVRTTLDEILFGTVYVGYCLGTGPQFTFNNPGLTASSLEQGMVRGQLFPIGIVRVHREDSEFEVEPDRGGDELMVSGGMSSLTHPIDRIVDKVAKSSYTADVSAMLYTIMGQASDLGDVLRMLWAKSER